MTGEAIRWHQRPCGESAGVGRFDRLASARHRALSIKGWMGNPRFAGGCDRGLVRTSCSDKPWETGSSGKLRPYGIGSAVTMADLTGH